MPRKRLFKVKTNKGNTMTVSASSQLQARNKFNAMHTEAFGKILKVTEVVPKPKFQIRGGKGTFR